MNAASRGSENWSFTSSSSSASAWPSTTSRPATRPGSSAGRRGSARRCWRRRAVRPAGRLRRRLLRLRRRLLRLLHILLLLVRLLDLLPREGRPSTCTRGGSLRPSARRALTASHCWTDWGPSPRGRAEGLRRARPLLRLRVAPPLSLCLSRDLGSKQSISLSPSHPQATIRASTHPRITQHPHRTPLRTPQTRAGRVYKGKVALRKKWSPSYPGVGPTGRPPAPSSAPARRPPPRLGLPP